MCLWQVLEVKLKGLSQSEAEKFESLTTGTDEKNDCVFISISMCHLWAYVYLYMCKEQACDLGGLEGAKAFDVQKKGQPSII